jgi:hypothetical protein
LKKFFQKAPAADFKMPYSVIKRKGIIGVVYPVDTQIEPMLETPAHLHSLV